MKLFIASQRHWLVVERLPAYAPDLNPVEMIWGNLKSSELANLCVEAIDCQPSRNSLFEADFRHVIP
jgi:transposase